MNWAAFFWGVVAGGGFMAVSELLANRPLTSPTTSGVSGLPPRVVAQLSPGRTS